MKLYVISGLGADFKVLERINFPKNLEVVFLQWLVPHQEEEWEHYIERMAESIDKTEPFCLLGYSFGGIVVQEIHKRYKAEKVVILGSIKSDKEKSPLIKAGEITKIPRIIPKTAFNDKGVVMYSLLRKIFDSKTPGVLQYFRMKDPYYLKWSIIKISEWKFEKLPDIIQIMGDKDIVFPIKLSQPEYIIKGGTHLFPATKYKKVSKILEEVFSM
ncbi:MAG: hypothetical protein CSA38_02455 [Flavobacteriales bacterium]|nr:MAG: hypothetical protein CSA38_02455 [Flavobacteriales bacterium]